MMNALIALGMGIVIFALVVGIGVVVLQNFGGATSSCATVDCGTAGVYNWTSGVCSNSTSSSCSNPSGYGYTTTTTLTGYMTNNLITWVPAIIALGVGLLFIGALMGQKGSKY